MRLYSAFYDLYYMNKLLISTISDNSDINTKSIQIVLVERNGIVVSTSLKEIRECIMVTNDHLSVISDHFKIFLQRNNKINR